MMRLQNNNTVSTTPHITIPQATQAVLNITVIAPENAVSPVMIENTLSQALEEIGSDPEEFRATLRQLNETTIFNVQKLSFQDNGRSARQRNTTAALAALLVTVYESAASTTPTLYPPRTIIIEFDKKINGLDSHEITIKYEDALAHLRGEISDEEYLKSWQY